MKMNIKNVVGTVNLTMKKYAPEILLGIGITGVCVGTVLACKATLKCEEIIDARNEKLEKISEELSISEEDEDNDAKYLPEDAKKDIMVVYMTTAVSFAKLYAPSVTLIGTSIGCILGAYRIMSKRNVALMAAYKVVEEAFTQYRNRVIEELGADRDSHFMYGTDTIEETETITDADGKKKKVKKQKEALIPGAKLSGFARMFEEERPDQYGSWEGSTQWSPVHDYNLSFLKMKEAHFNDRLAVNGFVTINDVYEELGFPATEAGMICGWRYKSERGDGYISFAPHGIDGNWAGGRDGDPIVMDFNIDGVIFDQSVARKELR